ncbi:hypothetical protein M758_8G009500 [Ceratodon purpureus]|uniref:Smr domain-containing protein n=1 Tax=Ceratodon purpureus TaxID=3225 RepID=A0A8T0GZI3_CERPU|nr:hypothetical protein KC19_8G010100 [Ceratodon purpureus]KAG0607211.1 hypothetical protein M758_8G009500 [Ceratodon purpureus]
MAVAFHGSFLCSPLKQIPGTTSFTLGGAWQWRQMSEMGCCVPDPFLGLSLGLRIGTEFGEQYPVGVLSVRCASKSATRVLQEVVSVGGTNGAKLLVRRSRGLSRVAQMEVLEELVQRGQCELVLPMYEAVRKGARYKWDANLHARIVAMVSKGKQTFADSSHILEPLEILSPKQRAELECALIESYISQDLVNQAYEAFHRLCELPLAKSRSLGYRALVRAYSAAEKPVEAEKTLMELKSLGCPPTVDDYKALLLGFGKLGMLTDMERIAADCRKTGMKLDTAGFNMMISAYCYAGMLERMVEIYLQMEEAGIRPSLVSWNALTKACPTLVAVGVEGTGALASPQTLCNRLQNERASSEELNIVQFLLAQGLPSESVTFSSDIWQLDLHKMSVGTASIVLPLWLSSLRDRFQRNDGCPVEVRLVTGWGKHSKSDFKAPVRKMIMTELLALKSPFKADSENRGAFITRGPSLKQWLSTLPS